MVSAMALLPIMAEGIKIGDKVSLKAVLLTAIGEIKSELRSTTEDLTEDLWRGTTTKLSGTHVGGYRWR